MDSFPGPERASAPQPAVKPASVPGAITAMATEGHGNVIIPVTVTVTLPPSAPPSQPAAPQPTGLGLGRFLRWLITLF